MKHGATMIYPYYYRCHPWDLGLPPDPSGVFVLEERKGQFCRVTTRGKKNSCCVEFEDGYKMVASRNALRKRTDETATVLQYQRLAPEGTEASAA